MVTRLCRTAINSCCRAAMQLSLVRQRRLLAPVCCCLLLVLLLLHQPVQQQRWPAKLLPTQSAKRVGPINPDQPSRPYHDDFEYLLNPAVCGADGEPVYAVVVVHSDPRHPEVRQAIRDSLPAEELAVLGVKRAFMLADASTIERTGETTIPQRAIVEENAMFGDLVQGNFHDSYYNLTLKHIMALDWAATFCPQARYIVKMDDDIVYNVYELMKVLQLLSPSKYLGGNLFPNSRPYRGISKWHVSYEEWPRTFYPPYLSGWLYIITQDVARALVLQSTVVPFFWIDDLFVTGVLSEHLPFTIRGLNNLFVTSAGCANYTVKQHFSEDQPSDEDVYSPNFVVGPTDHDLEVLKAFNRLCSYCERRLCRQRSRLLPLCGNNL